MTRKPTHNGTRLKALPAARFANKLKLLQLFRPGLLKPRLPRTNFLIAVKPRTCYRHWEKPHRTKPTTPNRAGAEKAKAQHALGRTQPLWGSAQCAARAASALGLRQARSPGLCCYRAHRRRNAPAVGGTEPGAEAGASPAQPRWKGCNGAGGTLKSQSRLLLSALLQLRDETVTAQIFSDADQKAREAGQTQQRLCATRQSEEDLNKTTEPHACTKSSTPAPLLTDFRSLRIAPATEALHHPRLFIFEL